MIGRNELESVIDAALTVDDSRAVANLAIITRELYEQVIGVEVVLYAVEKRPPGCSTEDAVRFAVGMPARDAIEV